MLEVTNTYLRLTLAGCSLRIVAGWVACWREKKKRRRRSQGAWEKLQVLVQAVVEEGQDLFWWGDTNGRRTQACRVVSISGIVSVC